MELAEKTFGMCMWYPTLNRRVTVFYGDLLASNETEFEVDSEGSERSHQDVHGVIVYQLQINKIPSEIHHLYENIVCLHISSCVKIQSICREDLKGLEKLREIAIISTKIEVIPSDLFADLVNLEVIELLMNRIKFIGKGAFGGLKNIGYIDLGLNAKINAIFVGDPFKFPDDGIDNSTKCETLEALEALIENMGRRKKRGRGQKTKVRKGKRERLSEKNDRLKMSEKNLKKKCQKNNETERKMSDNLESASTMVNISNKMNKNPISLVEVDENPQNNCDDLVKNVQKSQNSVQSHPSKCKIDEIAQENDKIYLKTGKIVENIDRSEIIHANSDKTAESTIKTHEILPTTSSNDHIVQNTLGNVQKLIVDEQKLPKVGQNAKIILKINKNAWNVYKKYDNVIKIGQKNKNSSENKQNSLENNQLDQSSLEVGQSSVHNFKTSDDLNDMIEKYNDCAKYREIVENFRKISDNDQNLESLDQPQLSKNDQNSQNMVKIVASAGKIENIVETNYKLASSNSKIQENLQKSCQLYPSTSKIQEISPKNSETLINQKFHKNVLTFPLLSVPTETNYEFLKKISPKNQGNETYQDIFIEKLKDSFENSKSPKKRSFSEIKEHQDLITAKMRCRAKSTHTEMDECSKKSEEKLSPTSIRKKIRNDEAKSAIFAEIISNLPKYRAALPNLSGICGKETNQLKNNENEEKMEEFPVNSTISLQNQSYSLLKRSKSTNSLEMWSNSPIEQQKSPQVHSILLKNLLSAPNTSKNLPKIRINAFNFGSNLKNAYDQILHPYNQSATNVEVRSMEVPTNSINELHNECSKEAKLTGNLRLSVEQDDKDHFSVLTDKIQPQTNKDQQNLNKNSRQRRKTIDVCESLSREDEIVIPRGDKEIEEVYLYDEIDESNPGGKISICDDHVLHPSKKDQNSENSYRDDLVISDDEMVIHDGEVCIENDKILFHDGELYIQEDKISLENQILNSSDDIEKENGIEEILIEDDKNLFQSEEIGDIFPSSSAEKFIQNDLIYPIQQIEYQDDQIVHLDAEFTLKSPDIIIKVNQIAYPVHKDRLASQSHLFAAKFNSKPKLQRLELKFVNEKIFEIIRDFIYVKRIPSCDFETLKDIFRQSILLKIEKLREIATKMILEMLNVDNAVAIYQLGSFYCCEEMRLKAFDVLKSILPEQIKSEEEMNDLLIINELLRAKYVRKAKIDRILKD